MFLGADQQRIDVREMRLMPPYRARVVDRLHPGIGRSVPEASCSVSKLTEFFVVVECLLGVDNDAKMFTILADRFASFPH